MAVENSVTQLKDYTNYYRKKSRNKYLLETEYDIISRKRANDIMNNIVKTRKKEKQALLKLPEEIQNKFR